MAGPVVIGSERSEVGLTAAVEVLRRGGGALDAVEAALRVCEDNLDDHYIGTGGLPNAMGEVELDASVMVGSTRAFGAVAAVHGFPHPVSIARAVLEQLPQHCLLVGPGAEAFADGLGFARAELLTEAAQRLWREALAPSERSVEGEGTPAGDGDHRYRAAVLDLVRRMAPHDGPWGTIDVLCLDAHGELVAGVSTSGYPWKHPGRVGDSAIPGCGLYADVRTGAAACTGRGELAMRATGARQITDRLGAGGDPTDACLAMLADAAGLPDDFRAELRCLALTPDGRHGAAASQPGATYAVMTLDDGAPRTLPRAVSTA